MIVFYLTFLISSSRILGVESIAEGNHTKGLFTPKTK